MTLEAKELGSAIGSIHYEFYDSLDSVSNYLKEHQDKIQCVVSKADFDSQISTLTFGKTQRPTLSEYADHIDTMNFLTEL